MAETGEGGHGGQLQNWHSRVEMAVGCGFTACKYMIVRTICLNKALFSCVVDLFIYFHDYFYLHFTHLFMFPVVGSKENIIVSLTYALIHYLTEN